MDSSVLFLIFLVPLLLVTDVSAHFSLFGFGTKSVEAESASASAALPQTVVPAPPSVTSSPQSGFTSILFGTNVNPGTQNTVPAEILRRPGVGVLAGSIPHQSVPAGGMVWPGQPISPTPTNGYHAPVPIPPTPTNGYHPPLPLSQSSRFPISSVFPQHQHHDNNNNNKHHYTQTHIRPPQGSQVKSQNYNYPPPTLPQSDSSGLSFYNPNPASNLAKDTSGMPPLNSPYSQYDVNPYKNQPKKGTFNWNSPEGQLYEVNYVADPKRASKAFDSIGRSVSDEETLKSDASDGEYSYSPLKPINPQS